MNVIGDVKGKRCILIDDIVDSGGTLVNAANALLEQGATEVMAYITHGVLSGGAVAKITGSSLKTLVITDSIQPTEAVKTAEQHPRALDRAADGRGHRPHGARGERVEPVLLRPRRRPRSSLLSPSKDAPRPPCRIYNGLTTGWSSLSAPDRGPTA